MIYLARICFKLVWYVSRYIPQSLLVQWEKMLFSYMLLVRILGSYMCDIILGHDVNDEFDVDAYNNLIL